MGNLMGSLKYKDPSTVEECDSTWVTDSEDDTYEGEEAEGSFSGCPGPSGPRRCGEQSDSFPQVVAHSVEMSPEGNKGAFGAAGGSPSKLGGNWEEESICLCGDKARSDLSSPLFSRLFPLREQGLNFYAQELTQDEIKEFLNMREAKRRFLLAYTIMLDFFGIKLLDKNGNVARAANWQDRFQHLNDSVPCRSPSTVHAWLCSTESCSAPLCSRSVAFRKLPARGRARPAVAAYCSLTLRAEKSQHNYLRITRILKSLGELGFEAFKLPLVRLLLQEALLEGTLPNMRHSALEYFVYTVRARSQRRGLLRFAQRHYQPPENFIWGPPKRRRLPGVGVKGSRMEAAAAADRSVSQTTPPVQGRPSSPKGEKAMGSRSAEGPREGGPTGVH
ncbi:hypothetical protein P4O66_013703 [Electrophorus voltai]|uniref:Opioid growth factor receptor (OGFr) conserved domain-containing protein n=1 Tax=Electrophorus voltai TaxID=2609070 RepID=A0AAD8Z5I7_9TELE|nr:hypothetical protein P4O66_013703 [Electrophorus voltai]